MNSQATNWSIYWFTGHLSWNLLPSKKNIAIYLNRDFEYSATLSLGSNKCPNQTHSALFPIHFSVIISIIIHYRASPDFNMFIWNIVMRSSLHTFFIPSWCLTKKTSKNLILIQISVPKYTLNGDLTSVRKATICWAFGRVYYVISDSVLIFDV